MLLLVTLGLYVNGSITDRNNCNNNLDGKRNKDDKCVVWFGPRIGRRKRNPETVLKNMDQEEIEAVAAALNNPWGLMGIDNGKSKYVASI